MPKSTTTNYSGATTPGNTFPKRVTSDLDQFDRNDLDAMAAALEEHDHSNGKGAGVSRLGGVTFSGTPTAGQVPVAASASTAVWGSPALTNVSADVTTSETTTSTSYTDLATSGPAVTVTTGITRDHLIISSARVTNTAGDNSFMSPAVAGGAALDANAAICGSSSGGVMVSKPTLAAAQSTGATHTAKYKVASGTGGFSFRRIVGVAL